MNDIDYEDTNETTAARGFFSGLGLLAGLLLGGLAGAGTMLLLAPRSGKKTRRELRRQARSWRKQTTKAVKGRVKEVRSKAHELKSSIHDQAEDLQQRGQDVVDQQKERWSPVVDAGVTAVQDS